jgi:hypothetical protein
MKNALIFIILSLFFSCEREQQLPEQIIGTGEIIDNALIYQKLITHEMGSKEHVIKSKADNIFDLQVSFDNGSNYDSIDFSKYTLLGKYANGGCHVVFERDVSKQEAEKKYTYKIKVLQTGNCEINVESMNWVLIPKIEDEYSVNFILEE